MIHPDHLDTMIHSVDADTTRAELLEIHLLTVINMAHVALDQMNEHQPKARSAEDEAQLRERLADMPPIIESSALDSDVLRHAVGLDK